MLWAGVQLAAILFAAADIPGWAHHPLPRSSLALDELMAVDIFATAMLCPIFAATWSTIFINTILTLSFAELAGLLASETQPGIFGSWVCVTVWQIGICGWARQFKGQGQLYIVCLAVALSGGAVLLPYLRNEQLAISGVGREQSNSSESASYFRSTAQIVWDLALSAIFSYMLWSTGRYIQLAKKRSSTPLH